MCLAFEEKRLRKILASFELPTVLNHGVNDRDGLGMIFTSQGQPALSQFQRIVHNRVAEVAGAESGGRQIELPGCHLAESIGYRRWSPSCGHGKLLIWNAGGAIQVHPFLNGPDLDVRPT